MATRPEPHPLRNWIPYKLLPTTAQPNCRWLYLADQKLTAPFFDDTQQQCLSHPYNSGPLTVVSSLDGLIELAQTVPSVAPSAFIFHVSRCGSTLLAQLLSLNECHIVLSEVPLLDTLLRLPQRVGTGSAAGQEPAFRATLRLLSQQRTGRETHVFVKTDSWHILAAQTIRRLYPTTPFILLYRSPDAVIQSQRNRRGMQAIPGLIPPEFLGFTDVPFVNGDLDGYMAKVLERYFETLLTITEQDTNWLLLNYQADGMALIRPLIQFLDLPLREADYAALVHRCRYHGKYPGQPFQQEMAGPVRADYLQPAINLYEQLDEKRKQCSG